MWETSFLLATFLEEMLQADPKSRGKTALEARACGSRAAITGQSWGQRIQILSSSHSPCHRPHSKLGGLQVGAGCGLLGLVLAQSGCKVTLTETTQAMKILTNNVAANQVLHAAPHKCTSLPLSHVLWLREAPHSLPAIVACLIVPFAVSCREQDV